MLNKVEFSDLYKFLTSVGLIIIASAFLIPWLFMKQEIGLLISETEYNELVKSSKKLTDNRIKLGLFITKAIPYISGILFALGIIISTIGIKKWKRKQDTVDETDQLKLTELKAKINELDSTEIEQKAEEEVKKEISMTSTNSDKENEQTEIEEKPTIDIEELKSNLIDMENLFFKKIVDFNSFVYEPKSNIKIDNQFEIDIMLKSLDIAKYPDILIEVKYIQNKLKFSIVQDAFRNLTKAYSNLSKTRKKINTYLIVVYKQDIAERDEINRFLSAVNDYSAKFNRNIYKFIVMSDNEANNFDIKKIVK
ncbi:hypothetical protein [Algibacter sp. R77976]|uniref:hypothetical protein n=1 Tax=Algibacter sp. R77976 TaxID=3093873 RepID=UPI0037CA04AE